jgi:hypothetical protein
MLIYIEGGPEAFANKAFESDVLLDHPEFCRIMHDYRWTERTIRGTLNPELVAQVWRHVSVSTEQPAPGASPVPTAAEDSHAMASDATTREVETVVHSAQIRESVEAKRQPSVIEQMDQDHPELMAQARQEVADHTGETPTVEDASDLPDGEQLFLSRKRMKITVKEAAEGTGLATSKITAIENGTGKRTKPGEIRTYADYLTKREDGGSPRP